MNVVTAVYRNGKLELNSPVDWPDGTPVAVTPVSSAPECSSWLSLPPLDVGRFQETGGNDDLLDEMLSDSRD